MKYVLIPLLMLSAVAGAVPALHVDDPDGASAVVHGPVSAPFTLPDNMLDAAGLGQLRLKVFNIQNRQVADIPVQFEPGPDSPNTGTFWWLLPSEHEGDKTAYRYYAANPTANVIVAAAYLENERAVVVTEGDAPVLRYNQGATDAPDGIDPIFERGDYIHPLWAPTGAVLTDDYPEDHPHHRGINWSWATIQWRGETRDAFAVQGVKAEPAARPVMSNGPVFATVAARNAWVWDGGPSIVAESVRMRIYRQANAARYIDIEIELTPLVEGLEIGGRIPRGYSGFNLRMAPGAEQETRLRQELWVDGGYGWGDYAAVFKGCEEHAGLTVLEHAANPGYPNEWRQYPTLNFYQPAWPGGTMVALEKDQLITLRHRLYLHEGRVTEAALKALRSSYDAPASAEAK